MPRLLQVVISWYNRDDLSAVSRFVLVSVYYYILFLGVIHFDCFLFQKAALLTPMPSGVDFFVQQVNSRPKTLYYLALFEKVILCCNTSSHAGKKKRSPFP